MKHVRVYAFVLLIALAMPFAAYGQCGHKCSGDCVVRYADEFVKSVPENMMYLLSNEDLAAALEKGEEIVVLDIRPLEHFNEGHIQGSLHVPLTQLAEDMNEIPKDKKIAVVCTMDTNSAFAVAILQMRGFDAWIVEGGVPGWVKMGRTLVQ